MRTTSGPTSRNEVVPRGHRDPPLVSAGERRNRRVRRRLAFRSCSETSAWSARDSVIRAALFAARLSRVPVAVKRRTPWRSDPAARARLGPAPVRRGRSRHGCHRRFTLSSTACSAARSATCFLQRTRSIARSDLRDNPVPFVREVSLVNRSRSRVVRRPVAVRKTVAAARCVRYGLGAW
jgi:hypothetical protein